MEIEECWKKHNLFFDKLVEIEHEFKEKSPLTLHEYLFLRVIAKGYQKPTDIADHLGVKKSTVSGMVKSLTEKGWVEQRRLGCDKRSKRVRITLEGVGFYRMVEVSMFDLINR